MLKQYATMFGDHVWEHMVIAVSFWSQHAHSIAKRNRTCPGKRCKNEAWFKEQIQKHFLKVLHVNQTFEFVFADSQSQLPENIQDPAQQHLWAAETKKLWDFATKKAEVMKFKDVNDILQVSSSWDLCLRYK